MVSNKPLALGAREEAKRAHGTYHRHVKDIKLHASCVTVSVQEVKALCTNVALTKIIRAATKVHFKESIY